MADLPSPPILNPPIGWLGFLGIKSGGKQPGVVAQYLTPTMEMLPFYLAGTSRLVDPTTPFANVNNASVTFGTVPAGKAWIVNNTVAQGALGVAATIFARILYRDSSGAILYAGPSESQPFPPSILCQVRSDRVFVIPAGGNVAIQSSAAAAPTAFNWFVNCQGFEVSA